MRLGWLDLPASSRELVGRLAELRAELAAEGLDRIVLCGMGGSSLAPEVICRTAGVPLVVLDTTDPGQVAAAMTELERTVVVVSSKSGGTVETESQRRAFLTAFADSGLDEKEAGARFVVVTDPGSPLSETAAAMGARAVFLADPTVGGRYSALSAFGLVPSALAGADVGALLDEAEELAEHLNAADNPALELGLAMGAAAEAGRDKLDARRRRLGHHRLRRLGRAADRRVHGQAGRGILPVVLESRGRARRARRRRGARRRRRDGPLPRPVARRDRPPGCAVPGLGVRHRRGRPACSASTRSTSRTSPRARRTPPASSARACPTSGRPPSSAPSRSAAAAACSTGSTSPRIDGVRLALDALLSSVPPRGYLALMAYLDRERDADAVRAARRAGPAHRARRSPSAGRPASCTRPASTTRAARRPASFLQLTGAVETDLQVPDQPYTFGTLQAAQAAGDRKALADRDRPAAAPAPDRPLRRHRAAAGGAGLTRPGTTATDPAAGP